MSDYNAGVYRAQGGNELVIASSTGNSGTAGLVSVNSGARIKFAAGGYPVWPVQTLGTSQVATNITASGYTGITASTTGPTYTLAGPTTPGMTKHIICEIVAGSSPGTAIVNSNSTGVSFSAGGENELTFNAEDEAVTLFAKTTTAWRIVNNTGAVAIGTQTT